MILAAYIHILTISIVITFFKLSTISQLEHVSKEIGFRADRLKQHRDQLNLSQRELARRCGFSEALIRKYEEGISDPAGYFLKMIAENLNVSSDYLLGLTDDPRGHLGDAQIAEDEKEMINTFRREGWAGVIRLGAEHLPK